MHMTLEFTTIDLHHKVELAIEKGGIRSYQHRPPVHHQCRKDGGWTGSLRSSLTFPRTNEYSL
jgi:hypothetical protein